MKPKLTITIMIALSITATTQAEVGFHLLGIMTGDTTGDRYMEVQGIGDINADGYKDFAIGASWESNKIGYVDIYLGGSVIDTIADYRIIEDDSWGLGSSITSGDFNDDGFSDLVIGDYCYSNYEYLAGRVFIYWGGADFDTISDLTIECKGYLYFFGREVKNGGDINGDGVDDLLIGAPEKYMGLGYVFIYYGGKFIDNLADVVIQGGDLDQIGSAICGIGDINADGYDDMLIGTDYWDANYTYGKAYLMYGGDSIGTYYDTIYDMDTTLGSFGRYVGYMGDITGDTINEYTVLSPENIRIFSGNNIEEILPFKYLQYGKSICCISNPVDINNDSINDVIIGLSGTGALIYLGGTEIDTIPDYRIQSPSNYLIGHTIASIGDINNDGQQELLIGGMGTNESGKVCLYTFGEWEGITREINTTADDFKLFQNYPNPFNDHTTIKYYLPVDADIILSIYNLLGREVKILIYGTQQSGYHEVEWDGTNQASQSVPSGIYFYELSSTDNNNNNAVQSRKLIYLK